ncbi:hypothetical protein [Streptomyces sp. NPDC058751]|uniref:hypothetical protein n=1 Tax=Streptomyces sp. NPDC058751 TaxID=3346623 RepID=UPI0036C15879
MSGLGRTSVLALAGGILLLTGCQETAGTGSAAGASTSAAGTPASSADASAGASARTDDPDPVTSPSSSPARTAAPSDGPATGSPAPAGSSPAAPAGCRNLPADAGVKAEVTRMYRHDVTHFEHIESAPHMFFYGRCGTVRYAVTRFRPTAGATQAELVAMQDEGSSAKYFRDSGGGWVYVASDGLPAGPNGCADVPAIPDALAAAWGNCSIAP